MSSSGAEVAGGLPVDGSSMSPRDVELIRRLEAHGLTLLATAVAQRLQVVTGGAGQTTAPLSSPDPVLRNGGWPQDETVATDPGGRGHHVGQSRRSLRERQRVS
jgi:hypothetical protein